MKCLSFTLLLQLFYLPLSVHSLSYTLAPKNNEGYWHEMPVPVKNHLNVSGGATRFWRKSLRHPSNTFHSVAGLALDQFSIGVWVKTNKQFWQTFQSGVFWELACSNCGDPQATWSQAEYEALRKEQQNDLTTEAASDDCPINIRLEATPQQTIVRTIAPENQALSTCGPVPQQIQIINGVKSLNDNKWHHVAVVFDTKKAQEVRTLHERNQGVLGTDYRLELWVDGVLDGTSEGPINLKLLSGRKASELTIGRTRTDGNGNAYGSSGAIQSGIHSMGFMQSTMSTLEIRSYAMEKKEIENLARVDCVMSNWSGWSECILENKNVGSSSSTTAIKFRTRNISQYPMNGGSVCSTVIREEKKCESRFQSL